MNQSTKIYQEYLSIDNVSDYLNIKKKTIYAMTASMDIPYYRIGRLIRFKKDEIDAWMETRKVVKVDSDQKAKNILRSTKKSSINIQKFVRKTIDEIKADDYISKHGKSDRIEAQEKEINHGSI